MRQSHDLVNNSQLFDINGNLLSYKDENPCKPKQELEGAYSV